MLELWAGGGQGVLSISVVVGLEGLGQATLSLELFSISVETLNTEIPGFGMYSPSVPKGPLIGQEKWGFTSQDSEILNLFLVTLT